MAYIDRETLKNKKVYSQERHEFVVPVAEIDWQPTTDVVPRSEVEQAKQEVAREIVQILKDYAKSDDCLTYNMSDKEQNELCKIHNLGVNEVKQSISIIAMDIEKKYIGEVTKNV